MPDQVENLQERIADGRIDSTDTAARYLGLVARIRPLLLPGTRYLAYTSDIGEAFRPVVNSKVVTGAYGISIAYVLGDVAYEGWKGHLQAQGDPNDNLVIGLKVARRAAFQGTASKLRFSGSQGFLSLTWPSNAWQFSSCFSLSISEISKHSVKTLFLRLSLISHSAVRYSKKFIFSNMANPRIQSIGPTAVGLGIIPFLPTLFDEPVEHFVDKAFDQIERKVLGQSVPERSDVKSK
ncbi:hypothetical protein PSHT_14277 [Puccinia striiformis]|uniref:Mitochondrial fission process protein 1 n=1 Tax=Puccinia striiformis TaxID=27350 RepID=A0A2S4UL19_9BASI|nr:hypothetical protein PSHT_14277 [Puccinia striiformis]